MTEKEYKTEIVARPQIPEEYDPTDITPYLGKSFTTRSGSRYKITPEGTLQGPHGNGMPIYLLAGIFDENDARKLQGMQRVGNYPAAEETIRRHGEPPREGYHLTILTTSKYYDKHRRTGITTSLVDKIE